MVDALYIPLPTALHRSHVLAAFAAGKHVLLEKPVALSTDELDSMIEAAYAANKYLLDGTMMMHHPRTPVLVQHCRQSIPNLSRIETTFTFTGSKDFFANNIRCSTSGDPMGCVGDVGWYCVRMALLVFAPSQPLTMQVVDWTCTDEGVPMDATCLVKFQHVRTYMQRGWA